MPYSVKLFFRRLFLRWIYYPSLHWQNTRQSALFRANYHCQKCGAQNRPLDVHHVSYKNLWREPAKDLLVVCRPCHNKIHGRKF